MLDDPDASDGSLYEGSLYYQGAIGGTPGKFRFYDGSDWKDFGGGGGGGTSYSIGTIIENSQGINSGGGQVLIEISGSQLFSLTEWQDVNNQILSIMDIGGNLALGSSLANGYKLYVNGSAYTTGSTWATPDLRFKENILPLNNSLDKILNIQPVSFDWNKIGYPDMNFEQNRQIGLVAQEVEEQIPELVRTDTNGYKSIAYDKLTVVTIEAVKEQQEEIEQLKEKLRNQ